MVFTTTEKTPVMAQEAPIMIPPNVIIKMTKEDFGSDLANNQGALVIKFGADWCGPCKKIEQLVNKRMAEFPSTIQGAIIDIDENFEIYSFLKSKRQVNGVPVLLCYKKGNFNYIPDHVVVGADENQINLFFDRCMSYA